MTILEQILETKAAEVTFAKRQRTAELEAAITVRRLCGVFLRR